MDLKIIVENSNEAFGLKMEVDREGLRPDSGYTWRYTPRVDNWLGDQTILPATVEFDFVDKRWATYFQLKWAK